MIKIAKRLLSKLKRYLCLIEKYPPATIIAYSLIFVFLYLVLPLDFAINHKRISYYALFSFYLVDIFILFFLLHKHNLKMRHFKLQGQDLREEMNLLRDENTREFKIQSALREKISRYNSLKNIIENINQSLGLDAIAEDLVLIAFSMIAGSKGTCILYLVDNQTQKINIFKSRREDKDLVIKDKEGDIFDLWVLRHASPLFIEDIKKDFRFDSEQLKSRQTRPISSLVSVPFISDSRFLGILRLDSPEVGTYSQEDLRFLVTICELGSVALENGELFQKTQDLAIHDGLTSLYRKGYFLERLKEEVKKSLRKKTTLSLLMLDIDYFKTYNDKFGHSAGDIVLKNLSQNITDALKGQSAIIGRFGGEEFTVILLGVDKKQAVGIAESLRLEIEKNKIVLRRQETNVTVSIGVATFPDDASDETEIIMQADRAMYSAKQAGRNRVVCA